MKIKCHCNKQAGNQCLEKFPAYVSFFQQHQHKEITFPVIDIDQLFQGKFPFCVCMCGFDKDTPIERDLHCILKIVGSDCG